MCGSPRSPAQLPGDRPIGLKVSEVFEKSKRRTPADDIHVQVGSSCLQCVGEGPKLPFQVGDSGQQDDPPAGPPRVKGGP